MLKKMEWDVQVFTQAWDSLKPNIPQETLKNLIFHWILNTIKQISPKDPNISLVGRVLWISFLIPNGAQQDMDKNEIH